MSPDEDAIDAGFGVDLMRLACLAAEPLAPSQAELERAHEAERARALADLLDRLSARLGARAVTRRELIEAHLPEQAEAAAPATLGEARLRGEGLETGASGAPARPLRLFVRPEPIEALAEVPDGPPYASAGGASCTTSPPSKGRSASPRPGGAARTRRRATISAPRILKAAASGSTAKASMAARRRRRNGSCMGCSGDPFARLREKVAARSAAG